MDDITELLKRYVVAEVRLATSPGDSEALRLANTYSCQLLMHIRQLEKDSQDLARLRAKLDSGRCGVCGKFYEECEC